jgi:hypothetical protein
MASPGWTLPAFSPAPTTSTSKWSCLGATLAPCPSFMALKRVLGRSEGANRVCVCCWISSCSLPVLGIGRRLSAAEDLALNADQIALKIGAMDRHENSTQDTSQKFCDLIAMCGDLVSRQAI